MLARNNEVACTLQEAIERYEQLEDRYAKQRAQRVADKEKVDDAFGKFQAAEARCLDIERRAKAQLLAKGREIGLLQDDYKCAMAIMEQVHKKELEAKQAIVDEAKALVVMKDEEIDAVIRNAAEERRAYKAKAGSEKRKLLKAAKVIREAREQEKEMSNTQYQSLHNQTMDALIGNETTIISLVSRNDQLEKEHRAMSILLSQRFPNAESLRSVIEDNTTGKEEEKRLRGDVKHMKEQNENLLDKIQQMEAHYTRHQHGEQDARKKENELQRKVYDLEEKMDRQKQQIRDAMKQHERTLSGSISAAPCAALDALELENEGIRDLLNAERLAKAELQDQSNKLDDENMQLAMKHELAEAELCEVKTKSETLERSTAIASIELEVLRKATQHSECWAIDQADRDELLALLQKTADDSKLLVEENAKLVAEAESTAKWRATIEDKMDTKLRQWQNLCMQYQSLYYNEAQATTARLHDEIHKLKAEKGEKHWIQSEQPKNSEVADRNALRYAAMCGIADVDPKRIPSAVHDPRFVADSIPAPYEALRTLRPNESYSLFDAGKVWSKREFEPLSEEEAAKRAGLQEQGNGLHTGVITAQTGDTHRYEALEEHVKNPHHGIAEGPRALSKISKPEAKLVAPKKPMQGLVPTQARKPRTEVQKAPTKIPAVVKRQSRTNMAALKAEIQQEADRPPWESRFAQYRGMTKTDYEELEPENIVDFFNWWVKDNQS